MRSTCRSKGLLLLAGTAAVYLLLPTVASAVEPTEASAVCMDSDKGDTLVMRIQFFPAASDAKNIAISETVLRNDVRLFKTYAENWFDYHHAAAAGGSVWVEAAGCCAAA